MKKTKLINLVIFLNIFLFGNVALHAQDVVVNVDNSQWIAYPLIKKYGVNIPFNISMATLQQNVDKITDLRLRSVRVHNGWGMEAPGNLVETSPISLSGSNIVYNFTAMNNILNLIKGTGAKPLLVDGYGPQVLSTKFNDVPNDLTKWQQLNKIVADHIDGLAIPTEIEIGDGGDSRTYFNADSLIYTQVLTSAFNGLKNHRYVKPGVGGLYNLYNWEYKKVWGYEGNPDPGFKNIQKFLSVYTSDSSELKVRLTAGAALYEQCNDPGFWEAHMSGFSPLGKSNVDAVSYKAASALFENISFMNKFSGLTQVYIDQLIDDNNGVKGLVSQNGTKSPLYFALKLYNEMPLDRNMLTTSNQSVKGLASSNKTLSSIALWNTGNTTANTTINLSNIPFAAGDIQLFRIDSSHSIDGVLSVEDLGALNQSTKSITVSIPEHGLVIVKISSVGDNSMAKKAFGNYVKRDSFWWFKFSEGWTWQNFDPYTVTAYVGDTINKDWGVIYTGAYYEKIPSKIQVKVNAIGKMTWMDQNTALYLRVDFESYDPVANEYYYDYSVLYADANNYVFDASHGSMPDLAGKGGKETTVIPVDFTNPNGFIIDTSKFPLVDYAGNACFIFYLQNPGTSKTGFQAKFELSDASTPNGLIPVSKNSAIGKIYPTKISDKINVDLYNNENTLIEVFDINGKVLFKTSINANYSINASSFNQGIYMVKISNKLGVMTQKIIK